MITIEQIRQAASALSGDIERTPLLALNLPGRAAGPEIFLKLESRLPIGCFKMRGALNFIRSSATVDLLDGIWTASAGNMAQATAWAAARLNIDCTVVVPDTAPEIKLAGARSFGATIERVPFDDWWEAMKTSSHPGIEATMIHPFGDDRVIAGNATIGLEILEDLPDVDTILIPWGGGGLAVGIASAIRSLQPSARVFAVEVATAAPLAASWTAGEPTRVERIPSFVDGIGGAEVFPRMFDQARRLLDGSLVATVEEIEDAIRILHDTTGDVAEGAGACPVAVALSGRAPGGRIACVVSGRNIPETELKRILGAVRASS